MTTALYSDLIKSVFEFYHPWRDYFTAKVIPDIYKQAVKKYINRLDIDQQASRKLVFIGRLGGGFYVNGRMEHAWTNTDRMYFSYDERMTHANAWAQVYNTGAYISYGF
jgi:hypothetical protein